MPASRPSRPAAGLARPRGPLPARVYWTRRLLVLGTALLLVAGLARLLGTGSDGGDVERAVTASAGTGQDAAAGAASGGARTPRTPAASAGRPRAGRAQERTAAASKPRRTPLAQPQGRCLEEDVRVVPEVPEAVGGDTITVRLVLRTVETEACWWYASPDSLTMRIRSGGDEIWTSRECPRALPRRSVVLRRAADTVLGVEWSGRRSDEECSQRTEWALPGFYHVQTAALAGEPAEAQFEVTAPEPEVVTRTVAPEEPRRQDRRSQRRAQQR